ncbi:receptor-transporting protein 3 [Mus musculus]|uniref:Receptor-transporting protein 3 n=1 Tax=Mus musculus TaxID=10090 RepID=RTP3_MOUSE|nr:receptor-transporting protein 3 [Mus musculus]Q5QGU6.2 RecName: Full=Receptor-transporting protein 3; AltName: Full=Transmembrane protein 7 [Mus musculus]|eukprot:NP_694740.2 receptor-transporting protein 3 [Mus musculus]
MMEEDIGDTEQWRHVFQELMQEVKPWHKWTLIPDKNLLPNVLKPGWTQYQQKTFARFHCPSCSRSWASGRVLIVFHMRWCEKKAKGWVKMRVFAQRCNQCPEPPFATPEVTWDNISRILNNLLFQILKKCYKEGFKQMGEIPLLGNTSLEGPHDSSNCEACLLGFCAQNDLGQASKPPAPPLSPTSSKSAREPKVTVTCSNISSSRPSSKVQMPQASKVNPQASNPTKNDPKVSCTSKPPAPPLSPTSLKSAREPKVTVTCSNISSSRPSSKVQMPQASKVNPQTSNPTKNDPKISCTSKPSTTPRLTIQQLSVVSPPAPAPTCVIQMPSPTPIDGSRAADVAKENTRSKTPKALLSSPLYVPPTSSYVPPTSSYVPPTSSYVPPTSSYVPPTSSSVIVPISSSWRLPENTICQVERNSHIHPQSQSSCCGACCESWCEIFRYSCCEAACNCMSQSPLCCLAFLILFLLLWYLL